MEYERLLEFDSGIIVIALLCSNAKCIFWESTFEVHLCFEMYFLREQYSDLWLMISVAAVKSWLVWLLLIIFAFFICIWLYCYQISFTYISAFTSPYGLIVKTNGCYRIRLLKNAGSKPARGRFHHGEILASTRG